LPEDQDKDQDNVSTWENPKDQNIDREKGKSLKSKGKAVQ